MICRTCFQLGTQRARNTSDKRSRHVSRGVFVVRRRTINCCRNRAFSASSSARLRGRSARVPVTRFGRAGSASRRKSWRAADDRRAHRFLAHSVSWLNISVYLPADRSFRGARRVYHAQLAPEIRTDERCSQHRAFEAEQAERLRTLLHQSPRNFGKSTSLWTLGLAAEVSYAEGLTSELVSAETVRATLRRLGVGWRRAKQWITSPDPAYARKKTRSAIEA